MRRQVDQEGRGPDTAFSADVKFCQDKMIGRAKIVREVSVTERTDGEEERVG